MTIEIGFLDRIDLDILLSDAIIAAEKHEHSKHFEQLAARYKDLRSRIAAQKVDAEIADVYQWAQEVADRIKSEED